MPASLKGFCMGATLMALGAATAASAAPAEITIDDAGAVPENFTSTRDGTIYIGSMGRNQVYRVSPGGKPEPWVSTGPLKVLGVLADERTDTLWVCADDFMKPKWPDSALQAYSIKTATLKASYPLPNGGVCNDIAISKGVVYATDTVPGRILRLAKGAKALDVWFEDPAQPGMDGIAFGKDGALYTNSFTMHRLIRIRLNRDGSAGPAEVLKTNLPIKSPDAIRHSHDGRMLMVEHQGRLGEITVKGDQATIRVIRDDLKRPVGVDAVGKKVFVLEGDPYPKAGGEGGPVYHLVEVPLPK